MTVGGSATARSFAGTTAALNAYFRGLGRITYTTAPDATAPRWLTTTVSDGALLATGRSQIRVTPVNDRPVLAASALVAAPAGRPPVITHNDLLRACGARDVDGDPLRFRIESLAAGRIEKWDGFRWRAVLVGYQGRPTRASRAALAPLVGPGDSIRWLPPAGARGTVAAFAVRVSDGRLWSAGAAQVSVALEG